MPDTARPFDEAEVLAIISDPSGEPAPGCAVAIFRDGRADVVCAGFADIAARRRPDADTLFYAGSLAKQFTALALVQQVLAGHVRLEDDIRRHLPEMPARDPAITVRMLLHHTSGLPNYAKLAPLAGRQRPSDMRRAETLKMLFDYPGRAFPPGVTFEYSNGGYLLQSEIVARASGQSFADYVRAHIMGPLGMRRSRVLETAFPDDPNRAVGYMPAEDGFSVSEDVPKFGGAGAIMLTLNDLVRYFHDISRGRRVWTPEVMRLMTAPGLFQDGSPVILPVPGHIFGYGGGLMLSREWILHGGNFAGFQALFGWRSGTDLGVAVLCNRGDVDPLRLATRIIAAVAPEAPPPDAPRFTLAGPAGRFVSDALGAIYDVAEKEDETLEVTIRPPERGASSPTLSFARTAEGVYACGPLSLVFDPDRRGFRACNETVAVRYRRAP